MLYEGLRPKPSELFTIGEQEDYVVLEGWSGLEHAHGLEHGHYRCPVVTGAWTGWYGVVVGGDEHVGRRAPRAGHPDDHVLNGAGPPAPHRRLDTTATLDLGGQSERFGLRQDVLAYSLLCSRTDRMRLTRHHAQILHRPLCRESVLRGARGHRVGRDDRKRNNPRDGNKCHGQPQARSPRSDYRAVHSHMTMQQVNNGVLIKGCCLSRQTT